MWPKIAMTFVFTSMLMLIEAAPSKLASSSDDDIVLLPEGSLNGNYRYVMEPRPVAEVDWMEEFSEPDPRLEKRSVALSRLNFRPGKRSVPMDVQEAVVRNAYRRLNRVQRSVALSRSGFRPAKK